MSKKVYTIKQAIEKAQKYCNYQERCHQEINNKLYEWGFTSDEANQVLMELIIQGLINEERYARTFVRGKFKIKKWGRIKIINSLQAKKISKECIRKGLEEINETAYRDTLIEVLNKKAKTIIRERVSIKRNKLIKYAISKGFEYELIINTLDETFIAFRSEFGTSRSDNSKS